MASRKSVVDDCTTVLLRSSAAQIAQDRRYRAPSLDREPIAAIVSKAHQFEILSSAETTQKVRELTIELTGRATASIEAHSPTDEVPANHPLLVLQQVMIMLIAVDEASSTLMLRRANKSKGFAAYLKPGQTAETKTVLDQLADLLAKKSIRDLLVQETDLDERKFEAFVAALTLQETRLFSQRFVDHASSTNEVPTVVPLQQKRPRGRPKKMVGTAQTSDRGAIVPDVQKEGLSASACATPPIEIPRSNIAPPEPQVGRLATVDELLSEF